MNLRNVKLMLVREIRDQLRDRRTMFMIFVLPIMLYPLLGMSFLQMVMFVEEKTTTVLVAGAEDLRDDPNIPALFDEEHFAESLSGGPDNSRLFEVAFLDAPTSDSTEADRVTELQAAVDSGEKDVAIHFPPGFAESLAEQRESLKRDRAAVAPDHSEELETSEEARLPEPPRPEIYYSTAVDKSKLAYGRLSTILARWSEEIGKANLAASGVSPGATRPIGFASEDRAETAGIEGASLWSKALPVLLLLWALTGAFYPAVDLCAGEKERGTLETLLCSPAERSEIVMSKLLTIMVFSAITAALNLIAMGITGLLIVGQIPGYGPPPAMSILWLSLAMLPVSALFSALCLGLGAFAKSTKEGQYYLMPLLLIVMPLVIMPMAPGVDLTLGNALIPITGVVLVLRNLLEGDYLQALQFMPVVAIVTLGCCLLAIRWAIDQFNSESVLFRESERLDIRLWLRHLIKDKQPTPTVHMAIFLGVLILLLKFVLERVLAPSELTAAALGKSVVSMQIVVILIPTLLVTFLLTTSPRKTLQLGLPHWKVIPVAAVLALLMHPVARALQVSVMNLYPIRADLGEQLEGLQQMVSNAYWLPALLIVAVLPAICEELAFRGFVLSGFRHLGYKWRAIIFSSLFFGFSHGVLQQSLIASFLGCLIAYVAIQAGSIWPAMIFHVIHNGLNFGVSRLTTDYLAKHEQLASWLGTDGNSGIVYSTPMLVVCIMMVSVLLAWFHQLTYMKSREEVQHDAIVDASYEEALDRDLD